ncbi:VWA domain-containing protein [Phytoactinopolyspora alkaliphila]|uniref:VWA domain-containing protein n=1 Tax=Phytoactinopolyspora alkaliphila TaxID=1783498 RepID=A0A6N9YRC2_9ACTN|nr:substrate-binding and VWA domain-containing protein [Phytoactinopolyspora alkaliphila]NED97378.1 VWA domain-containing protein [Phytoactinopolyspora alkaliphila]
MSGRHAQRGHRRRFWARITAAVVAVGVLAFGAYVLSDYLRDDDVGRIRQEASCDAPIVVSVAAEPNIAFVLGQVVDDHQAMIETPDGECVEYEVAAAPSAAVVRELNGGGGPDVWVPESTLWLQRVSGDGPGLGESRQIATSPLVVVAPKPVARGLGWPDAEFSWTDMLGGETPATITDPMATTEGLATLLAVQGVVGGGEQDQARLVEAMTSVSRSAVADVEAAYELVSSGSSSTALFTATEQSVVKHNEQDPEHLVVALYPAEGTPVFDYPAVPINSGDDGTGDGDAARSAAIERLLEFLHTEPAVTAIQEAGFRSADGAARDSAGIVDGTQARMPAILPLPEPEAVNAAQRQWAALSLDMRMLAVIDVSGSMWETEGDAPPPIEVVRDANLAALQLIPPTSDLGLWVFSTEEDPPDHWREVVELGPLTDEVGDGTRLDALVAETKALPDSEVRGWTALYDTAWAAFRAVKENFDPNRVNSVVLLTDGEDERGAGLEPGMDLETLLTQLQAQHDPARPVLIITIGIGPDADMAALEQISGATGASAYQAVDPADLPEIFFQAMVERQCRPNC